MVDYKIVKYCRLCKVRFVVNKGDARKNYCDKCQIRLQEINKKEEKRKEAEEKKESEKSS